MYSMYCESTNLVPLVYATVLEFYTSAVCARLHNVSDLHRIVLQSTFVYLFVCSSGQHKSLLCAGNEALFRSAQVEESSGPLVCVASSFIKRVASPIAGAHSRLLVVLCSSKCA